MRNSTSEQSELQPIAFGRGMASPVIDEMLQREAKRIFDGFVSRKAPLASESPQGDVPSSWGESAEDWMLAEVYILVRQLRRSRKTRAIDRLIAKVPLGKKGRGDMSKHPFKQMLFLMFGEMMVPGTRSPLSRQRRMLLGDALEYADVHDVPAAYVNGFIKQAELTQCRAKLEKLYEEPRSERTDIIAIIG